MAFTHFVYRSAVPLVCNIIIVYFMMCNKLINNDNKLYLEINNDNDTCFIFPTCIICIRYQPYALLQHYNICIYWFFSRSIPHNILMYSYVGRHYKFRHGHNPTAIFTLYIIFIIKPISLGK